MTDDDLTPDDVLAYLIGVYKVLTQDDVVEVVVNQIPAIVPSISEIIDLLAPLVAYELTRPKPDPYQVKGDPN